MSNYLLFIFILFFSIKNYSQDSVIKFRHITVEEGLSQSWVHCIYQDKLGYMWFGTDDGLNRYDGYEITNYKYNTHDKNTISNNSILSIKEDGREGFWIGTENGLNFYDREKNIFQVDSLLPRVQILSLAEDDDNNLWVGTIYDLFYYNQATKKITQYSAKDENGKALLDKGYIASSSAKCILIDSKKNVWVATEKTLNLYKKESNSFINIYNDSKNPESLADFYINSLIEDGYGRIWVGHSNGLDLFLNPHNFNEKPKFRHFINVSNNASTISPGSVNSIIEYENELWVGVDNGGLNIMSFGPNGEIDGKFIHHRHNPGRKNSLSHNSVYSFYLDKQNNIWIGTYGRGVNMYNKYAENFRLFQSDINNKTSLSNNQVNAFCEDDEYVWIGTEKGLNRFSKKDNTFINYTHNPKDDQSIGSDAVWAICKNKKGEIWVGTWAGGLNKFDRKTGRFIRFNNNPIDTNSIGSNNVFAIKEDSDGNLWIGTMGGGLNMYDYKTGKFIRYNVANSEIYTDYVESIVEDKNGDLWIANVTTLARFDRKTKKFYNYIHNDNDISSLSGLKIYSVYIDSKSNIWIGTDVGLNVYRPEKDNFFSYQFRDGLPDNAIKSISEDKYNNLWLGTNKGLSKFIDGVEQPKNAVFKNYLREDGLASNEFNRRSCLSSSDGLMYFGGENGFIIFDPDHINENKHIPDIVFTDLLLFNEPVKIGAKSSPLTKHISCTRQIKLNYRQSVFTIRFVALNYILPEKNQYAYRMEGFEKQWNKVGNKREATYTNLNPGRYTFKVIAANNDKVWNNEGIELKIIIVPPWWKTIVFKVFFVLAIIVLIIIIYVIRVNNLNNQKRHLEILVKERTVEIERKNQLLEDQTYYLSETNSLLKERQQFIEEQAEELRAQAEQLNEKNKNLNILNATKDKFFSIIAHDLKNPFNSIIGFSELLYTRFTQIDDSKKIQFAQAIHNSVNNIYKLLENLLQWARAQTGTIKYDPEVIDLNEIIDVNYELVKNLSKEKQITMKKISVGPAKIYADRNMINTVVRNIISNAIKFTENGEILLEIKRNTNFWDIVIKDSGVGIPPQKVKNIFEIDHARSTQGTRGESGTGLGLIICKEFVEKNNGTITVESEEGKGSVFIISFAAV